METNEKAVACPAVSEDAEAEIFITFQRNQYIVEHLPVFFLSLFLNDLG